MSQLNFDAAVPRFKANEERVDKFVNQTGTYTTSGGSVVKTMPQLAEEFQDVIDAAAAAVGLDGWTPVPAIVADGSRYVIKVVDWTGGTGTKPAINKYIGSTGLVDLIANGVDIRGPEGASVGSNIAVQDEGSTLTSALTSMNFVGAAVTATNSTGAVTVTIPGLSYISEARMATTPNDTRPVHSWSVTGSETNIDFSIVPKGTGALLAAVPDSAATGGNKRGTQSVDLQMNRDAANKIVEASYSGILSGSSNRIVSTGNYSVIPGGSSNTINGIGCIVAGQSNTVSGQFDYNNAVFGGSNTVSGSYSIVAGLNNTNSGSNNAVFGSRASASRLNAMYIGNPVGTTAGRFQFSNQVVVANTTTNAATSLLADANAIATSNSFSLANNSAIRFRAIVVARDTSSNDAKEWIIEGLAKRGANAAATSLVGTPTVTSSFADSGASAWTIAVSVNTTVGCVDFVVTGETSKTIRWSCSISAIEVR